MGLTVAMIPAFGAPAVIYDANKYPLPDGNADGFCPKAARLFENTPQFRSAAPFVADRFNQALRWDFNVMHSFSSIQACQDFRGLRAQILPRSGKTQIIARTGQGSFTRYLYNAWLMACECVKDNGETCTYHYQILWTGNYSLS